jgi:F0F1-type ATP synthase assembly protein I
MSAILIADVLVAALLQVLLDHFMQGKRLPRK